MSIRTKPTQAAALVLALALAACGKPVAPRENATTNVTPAADNAASADTAQSADTGDNAPEWVSDTPPPPLPTDAQPPIPEEGYVWTPGEWAWNDATNDYYWVNGSWVQPPQARYLWTPGFWFFLNGRYNFHKGHWGPHVGFYGGVDYGNGYGGQGYQGGQWQGDRFYYNTAANNIANARIAHQYNAPAPGRGGRISYNGGAGGVVASPTPAEKAAAQESAVAPTLLQDSRMKEARINPAGRAGVIASAPPPVAPPRPASVQPPRPQPVNRPPAVVARPAAELVRPSAPPRVEARSAPRPAPARAAPAPRPERPAKASSDVQRQR